MPDKLTYRYKTNGKSWVFVAYSPVGRGVFASFNEPTLELQIGTRTQQGPMGTWTRKILWRSMYVNETDALTDLIELEGLLLPNRFVAKTPSGKFVDIVLELKSAAGL